MRRSGSLRGFLVLAVALLLLGGTGLGPARGGEGEARVDAALQARINKAVERGATWLAGRQRPGGNYPGFGDDLPPDTINPMDLGLNALVVQTLARCGRKADDPAIRRGLQWCRSRYSKGEEHLRVYSAATLILALLAVHAPEAGQDVRIKRDRYGNPVPPKRIKPCKVPTSDRHWIKDLVAFLVRTQVKPSGGWRYPGNPDGSVEGETDLSNTQYALLALDAAARCGFRVPAETWRLAGEYVLREQEEEGIEVPLYIENEAYEPGAQGAERFVEVGKTQARGWCYLPGRNELATGSMTCAGLTCLAVVKERLWAAKKLDPAFSRRLDRGMIDGIGWLGDHFTVQDNPDPPNQWHYYYLYGLERTGAKTGLRWIGRHDWYREGAEHLLAAQTKEGGWQEAEAAGKPADSTESAITQTCFALLFLERATRKPVVPMTPPTLTGGDDAPPADNR
ncbi:MAG: hypothetical protein ACC662_03645 [Planctomycetota bacterium]